MDCHESLRDLDGANVENGSDKESVSDSGVSHRTHLLARYLHDHPYLDAALEKPPWKNGFWIFTVHRDMPFPDKEYSN
jgi:hypothetical protein